MSEPTNSATPLRIVYLMDSLRVGGKERQAIELLKGVARRPDMKAIVVTMGTEQFYVPDVQKLKVPLHYVIRRTRWDPLVLLSMFRIFRSFRPHVIHTNSWMCTAYAWPLARLLGVKLVDGSIRDTGKGNGIRWKQHLWLLRLADARIANSIAGFASRGMSPKAPGNFVIYNGFDLDRFSAVSPASASPLDFETDGRKIVAMVGEFTCRKDFPTYIRAASEVLKHRDDVMFLAIGGGETFEACRQMVPPEEQRFRFLGPRKDVEALVRRADIGVLCSFGEGIPNAVMEFMAAGKPVVLTNLGGSGELISDGVHGFLVPVSDAGAIAEKIELLLNNPVQANNMGSAGREHIEHSFSLAQLITNTRNVYEQLTSVGHAQADLRVAEIRGH